MALEEQAKDQSKPDPATGGQRKVSRADVITRLVREGRDLWEETVALSASVADDWAQLYHAAEARRDEAEQEAEESREKQAAAERRVDQLEGELEAMRARVADLEREVKQKARLLADQNKRILELMGGDVSE